MAGKRKIDATGWRIIAVNAMVLLTMAILIITSDSDRNPAWWVYPLVFAPPILAIVVTILVSDKSSRRWWYVGTAVLMLPAVAFGVFAGWGLLYAIAIAFLVFASRE